jgi:hypothetical protein
MKVAKRMVFVSLSLSAAVLSGCASTYSNLTSGSELGAKEYRPAVYVPPEKKAQYEAVLDVCRKVAVNRQVTAAQEAQLRTISGAVAGTTSGLASGIEMGNIFKQAGLDHASINRSAGLGAVAGLAGSLGSSFASGLNRDAAETKRVLLACLRTQESLIGYRVME